MYPRNFVPLFVVVSILVLLTILFVADHRPQPQYQITAVQPTPIIPVQPPAPLQSPDPLITPGAGAR